MKSTVSLRKRLLICAIGFASILCLLLVILVPQWQVSRKVIKFSVDDATEILMEISVNDYDSIFESDRMSLFKEMHEKYDLDVTLFLFENLGNYSLNDFPDRYKNEFKDNSDWLKLGWHGIDDGNPQESGYTGDDFIQSYINTTDEIIRFAGKKSLSKELRIHYWYTDDEALISYLSKNGVNAFYYSDTDALGYDFTQDEDKSIRSDVNGVLCKRYGFRKVSYILTDIRLDYIRNDEELISLLQSRIEDREIVIFTHAWVLNNSSQYIETMCRWATDNYYVMNWN